MIGCYGMSLTGSSHLAKKQECQDANCVKRLENGWIVAAVADGLGSARRSEIGSRTAVETVVQFIEENLPDKWHDDNLIAILRVAFIAAAKAVESIAKKQGRNISEYETTLTLAVYNGANVVYGHVGDGGIITLSRFGEFSQLTKTQKGDAHNETIPLRAGPDYWVFGKAKDSVCALVLMTDGIYDFFCPPSLSNTKQPIFLNRVRPFVDNNILNIKTQNDFDKVKTKVKTCFTGEQTSLITDDKTLVGIINTDELPDEREDSYYKEPDWKEINKFQKDGIYKRDSKASELLPDGDTQAGSKIPKQAIVAGEKHLPLKESDAPSSWVKPLNLPKTRTAKPGNRKLLLAALAVWILAAALIIFFIRSF
jgi:serine/threonine protein phosphatase PrpC